MAKGITLITTSNKEINALSEALSVLEDGNEDGVHDKTIERIASLHHKLEMAFDPA